MPLKQGQVELILFPALVSAIALIMVISTQEVSGRGCEDSSCDSLVNIDGINIGKIDGDKILNTEDITKILDNDKTKLEDVQTTNGADGVDDAKNDKIKIKDLNVLLDGDDKAPKIEVLPDNVTVIKIKSLSEQFVTDVTNENNLIDEIRSALLNSRTFSIDVVASGQDLTVAYSPVLLDGKRLLTIILALPHIPEASVENLVLLQRNFGLVAMITIGIISFGVFYGVTNWHKEMRKQVLKHKIELEQRAEKLAIIDQGQKEFIDIAAHEFRTPIQSVLGYSEFIRSSLVNFDDYFDNLFKNAKRLEKITNDILDVSKIDSENYELSKTDFDLNDVIKKAIGNHEKDASDKNVKIILEPKKEETRTINADESKIQQVIDNLLSNALDFTKDGTITLKVYDLFIRSDDKDNQNTQESIALEVKDTGSGINEEIMPRLFEKFSRRSDSGAGLGLYISKKIVDMHGGKFWAQNNRGAKGATFTITLPIYERTK